MARVCRGLLAACLAFAALLPTALPAQAAPSEPVAVPLNGHGGAHTLQFVFLTVGGPTPVYTQAEFEAWTGRVRDYWLREARGQLTALTADWSAVVTAQSRLICADARLKPAEAGAQALGYASYDAYRAAVPEATTTLVVVTPEADFTACLLSSAAQQKGATTSAGVIWIKAAPATPTLQSASDLAHEVGHIFGLGHAGAPSCPAGVVDDPLPEEAGQSACDNWGGMINNTVYGDQFNLMGNGADGIEWPLHAWQKVRLGLVGADAVPTLTTATAGVHTLTLADSSTTDIHAVQGVAITDYAGPGDTRWYVVEVNARAGGLLIRRLGQWAGAGGSTASQILSPEGSQFRPKSSQVFPDGSVFTAASGNFTVAYAAGRVTVTTTPADPFAAAAEAVGLPTWEAGHVTVPVTANTGWTARAGDAWLTVAAGDGEMVLSAAANPGAARDTLVTLTADGAAATTIRVCQPAAGQQVVFCPSRVTAPADGVTPAQTTIAGQDAFTDQRWGYDVFTADPAIKSVYWAPDGQGGLTLSVVLYPNLTGADRQVRLEFTPRAGPAQTPAVLVLDQPVYADRISLSADTWAPSSAAASRRLQVSTNLDTWTLDRASLPDWLTANLLTGTDGSTTLLSAAANPGAARQAEVVFTAGQATAVFHVTQAGAAADPYGLAALLERLRALLLQLIETLTALFNP
jgi:hypothetical protein